MRIDIRLKAAADRLADAGITDPRRESASLLAHVLRRSSAFLIAHPEYEMSAEEDSSFTEAIERRASREPFQHIVGKQEFWGLDFDVRPGVLIPRPETEILVEEAVDLLNTLPTPRFAEIGVGSGCISISILYSVPNATAIATDISDQALQLSARNASIHHVDARLELRNTTLLDGVESIFDLVVSNPPYIPDLDIPTLEPEVRDHEPYTALKGGADGLDIVRLIVAEGRHKLKGGGVLIMEIGFGQDKAVASLFDQRYWQHPIFRADLQHIPRVVIARRRS